MPTKIIACEVLKEELSAIKPLDAVDFEFVPLGLHLYPEKLGKELQRILDSSKGYSRVVLAFGLCGGAARNLRASDFFLTIPRVHDCIPLLLGSKERFEQLRAEEKGTLYLTCGWMKGERSTLSEYSRISKKYGEKKASNIWRRIYDGYRRVLFIFTSSKTKQESLQQSQMVARLLGLNHQTTQGTPIYIEKIVNGPWETEDFITIPPNEVIDESYFYIR